MEVNFWRNCHLQAIFITMPTCPANLVKGFTHVVLNVGAEYLWY